MTKIFLETGKASTPEYVFVRTLLDYLQVDRNCYKIECVNGKDNLPNVAPVLLANTNEGGRNLIIFDADSDEIGGGYDNRLEEMMLILKQSQMQAELFLFPNNCDDGMFENLLERIMRTDLHKQFIDCFSDYEACLGSQYVSPNLKGKLHTYISSMKNLTGGQRKKLGQGEWLFDREEFWDLKSPYLQPLVDFLKGNMQDK